MLSSFLNTGNLEYSDTPLIRWFIRDSERYSLQVVQQIKYVDTVQYSGYSLGINLLPSPFLEHVHSAPTTSTLSREVTQEVASLSEHKDSLSLQYIT